MDPPSVNVTFSQRMEILWRTNKALVIAIITAIVLIIIGIILLIIFLVIKPGSNSSETSGTTPVVANSPEANKAVVKTAHHLYVHLRNMAH